MAGNVCVECERRTVPWPKFNRGRKVCNACRKSRKRYESMPPRQLRECLAEHRRRMAYLEEILRQVEGRQASAGASAPAG